MIVYRQMEVIRVDRVGELIRVQRIAKGYTQQALGELLGYTGRSAELTLQSWESGRRKVVRRMIKPLSELLDIPIEQLLE